MEQAKNRTKSVPFFSQGESRDITNDVLARGALPPARRTSQDPVTRTAAYNGYLEKSLDRNSKVRLAWACSSKNLRDARSSITSRSRMN